MWEKELEYAILAGKKAKVGIINIYKTDFSVEIKNDNSPVTLADKNADKLIREVLSNAFPNYAFLTEESEDNLSRLNNDYVWIVDPVDGTKDFVVKDDEFTINIALAYKHEIVLGVVFIPARDIIYYAKKGDGAFKVQDGLVQRIHVSDKTNDLTVYRSVFHFADKEKECIERHKDKITNIVKVGSSIKACYIAEGKGELSYRMSDGTKEWDTAAFSIIVEEAGGLVLDLNGNKMKYNREDVYNRDGYIIMNRIENNLV